LSWLIEERSFMSVHAEFPGDHPEVDRTAVSLGMRRCFRIRERTVWGNRRYDALGYQALHPAWLARLGEPPHGDDGPVDRDTPSPAPRSWSPRFDPPPSAVMVGDRLYLRAMTAEDAELAARAMLSETERFLPEGRLILNPRVTAQFVRDLARQQPPWWVRFAVVLGATGEPIGTNGLMDLDLLERSAETESEIWYAEHRSQGYGTEAKHLLLSYAFERLGPSRRSASRAIATLAMLPGATFGGQTCLAGIASICSHPSGERRGDDQAIRQSQSGPGVSGGANPVSSPGRTGGRCDGTRLASGPLARVSRDAGRAPERRDRRRSGCRSRRSTPADLPPA
jgi:RimJ/RimL family protein N-acetyltransferase